ncbi:unnamed protein product [Danaus chrysippus]|uniref:(African queen) hypothetical protein n=1 Tax=Danaus chrysippus TaxID=151541 RepID=A0A8J2R1N4_9NEOP|nr:unnamed protein product [Danaus chrysippus]
MEDSTEPVNVSPELYFLIAKFLSGGPLKETAKTLLKELASAEVLPRRIDWEGNVHSQSYDELDSQYSEISWKHLVFVCERALQLARYSTTPAITLPGPESTAQTALQNGVIQSQPTQIQLKARLSLLSESLTRPPPKYASFKQDHTLVRRLVCRELGGGGGSRAGSAGGAGPAPSAAPRPFPARLLRGLTLQRRTLGHLSAVYCLVFDRTGRYVVTGADDLLVKVWSALDGRLCATLRGAGAEITDVSASWDGALLACGSVERLVRVWCLATGAPRAVLQAHAGTITSVAWSPPAHRELRWLASTSTDGSVAFWTCSLDGHFLSQPVQYVERLRPGACHMICAAWSAGGAFLAAGSADQRVRVYALEAAGPRRVLEMAAHTDAVDSLAWAHRGLRFVSGSKDGTAALWTLHATQWRHTLLRAQQPDEPRKLKVTMVCWDASDEFVVTAVSDRTLRVWCSRRGEQLRSLAGHRDEAYVLEAHPRLPGVLLSAGHDGQLFVWHVMEEEPLARFHNEIEGQGEGAIFDAKWGGGGATVAAADSHGHLVLLGLGAGHRLLSELPRELFFHTDYRPLARDALGGALDEQTELPPHLMPPPFLVDVEGAPHAPRHQRLVPGREALPLEQLVPRTRLDAMIEALAADPLSGGAAGAEGEAAGGHGVWRGEGVRHTAGSWQGLDVPLSTRPIVPPLAPSVRDAIERASVELNAYEMSWYRREMRRRPVMISTAGEGPRRRPGRRPRQTQPPRTRPPPPRAQVIPLRVDEEPPEVADDSADTSDESVRLSGSQSSRSSRSRSSRTSRSSRSSRTRHSSAELCDSDSSHSPSKSDSSSSSQYSDWEGGSALSPPQRARRRPARRPPAAAKRVPAPCASAPDLPEAYRVGEWLTAVSPRKAPYHPQMGDRCLYFRLGHQRYFEAVAEKDLYKINSRDKPWERMQIYECEAVQVVGIKYVIRPPRVASLKLVRERDARSFTVRYHDMPDVIDFLVLRHHYDAAVDRRWGAGDRFRCMIDDSWWTGQVVERMAPDEGGAADRGGSDDRGGAWAKEAAGHFLSLRVRWDNGEVERLSPWDLEPIDPERLPTEPGGAVPVLPRELEAVLLNEWPPHACRTIAQHISQVMSLSVAEPFVAPVDLQLYPSYALVVPYPVDLATIRARFENLFYRRAAAAQFDARWLATNAERFNEPRSPIVRQARLVTDLLLNIIRSWEQVDVVAQYHELAASYHSDDDDDDLANKKRPPPRGAPPRPGAPRPPPRDWRAACSALLRELTASADAEPFRHPVSSAQAPDYRSVVTHPMDLGTVSRRLSQGHYSRSDQLAADVRLVFANSRLYNTNKRSRIYSMTVRLSSLFESLWSRLPVEIRSTREGRTRGRDRDRGRRTRARRCRQGGGGDTHDSEPRPGPAVVRPPSSASSECEPLAATSRRVHALRETSHTSSHGSSGPGSSRHDNGSGSSTRVERPPPARADSWDSDVPLTSHRKGKGVGKKSKNTSTASSSQAPPQLAEEWTSAPESESPTHIEVVEEELVEDEVELEYEENTRTSDGEGGAGPAGTRESVKRRPRSSGSSDDRPNKRRLREPYSSGSCSSSSSESGSASGSGWRSEESTRRVRYESDRSYRPNNNYSTDDDAPLLHYRQRQGSGPGSRGGSLSGSRSGSTSRRPLRRRGSPRRYNEDSEDDSVAAISKRLPSHRHNHNHSHNNHVATTSNDHDYYNGHGPPRAGSGGSGPGPVSISSRGRVRRLTAKARGLLRP